MPIARYTRCSRVITRYREVATAAVLHGVRELVSAGGSPRTLPIQSCGADRASATLESLLSLRSLQPASPSRTNCAGRTRRSGWTRRTGRADRAGRTSPKFLD